VVGGPGAVPLRGNQRPGVVTTLHATRVLSFAPAVGKPYEGEPHVRFDEGAAETGRWSARPGHSPERGETARGRRTCDGTAPLPHSTPAERARQVAAQTAGGRADCSSVAMPWATASCSLVMDSSLTTRIVKGWPEATAQKNCTMTSPLSVRRWIIVSIDVEADFVALLEEPGALGCAGRGVPGGEGASQRPKTQTPAVPGRPAPDPDRHVEPGPDLQSDDARSVVTPAGPSDHGLPGLGGVGKSRILLELTIDFGISAIGKLAGSVPGAQRRNTILKPVVTEPSICTVFGAWPKPRSALWTPGLAAVRVFLWSEAV